MDKWFDLSSKHVIHTVCPVYKKHSQEVQKLLGSCYKNALDIAENQKIKSLAFLATSTGIYGYPINVATIIAVETIRKK